jgi:hypothetical protein
MTGMSNEGETSGDPAEAAGIELYDLKPCRDDRLIPVVSPLRHPGRPAPRPRYAAPPVPDGHVRVKLGDDYYAGAVWRDWAAETAERPADIFDIPAGQRDRWAKALADYAAMQEEIGALRETRWRPGDQVPPGWVAKQPYQVQS